MLSLGSFEQLHTSARRKYWNNHYAIVLIFGNFLKCFPVPSYW